MRLYAVCPICEHKLLKGDDGTNVEVLYARPIEELISREEQSTYYAKLLSQLTRFKLVRGCPSKNCNKL